MNSDDVFGVELLDGYLYLVLQQSSAAQRKQLSDKRLSDGVLHTLTLEFRPWGAAIMVRSQATTIISQGKVPYEHDMFRYTWSVCHKCTFYCLCIEFATCQK